MVDWDLAVATARRLVSRGPQVTYAEAAQVVAELRELAVAAERHVGDFTGLSAATEHPPVVIVDRPAWAEANVAGFRVVLDPLVTRLSQSRPRQPGPLAAAIGQRVTGVQVGSILSFLAGKVLGQFEVFGGGGAGASNAPGRLLLVAPNIVATERSLQVDPHDFRLWVCLHEVTHRTQFAAVPWLREHFLAEVRAFVEAAELDPAALRERLAAAIGALARAAGTREAEPASLIELVQTPAQRVVLDRLTALMTLLEGHAEYVMDGVGPQVVPSVATIRARFGERRKGTGPVDRAVRRLLGLEAKMRQYAEGGRFVRAVVDEVGMAGFNVVWTSPQTLPRLDEIDAPQRWISRVLGSRPAVPA